MRPASGCCATRAYAAARSVACTRNVSCDGTRQQDCRLIRAARLAEGHFATRVVSCCRDDSLRSCASWPLSCCSDLRSCALEPDITEYVVAASSGASGRPPGSSTPERSSAGSALLSGEGVEGLARGGEHAARFEGGGDAVALELVLHCDASRLLEHLERLITWLQKKIICLVLHWIWATRKQG